MCGIAGFLNPRNNDKKTEKEINEQLEKDRKELRRANALEIYRDELEQIKKQIAAAASDAFLQPFLIAIAAPTV